MKKIKLILIFAILLCSLLLISGCALTGGSKNSANIEQQKISTNPKGIVPELTIGTSDIAVLGRTVTVNSKVRNLGSTDTQDTIYTGIKACGALTKKDGDNFVTGEMDKEVVQKNDENYGELTLPGLTASFVTDECKILSNVCYTYQTELVQTLHFVSGPVKYKLGQEIKQQGSPLNVVAIYQDLYDNDQGTKQLQFQIYIENKGDGVIIRKNDYDKPCQDIMIEQYINIINLYDAEVYLGSPEGGIKLSCYTGDSQTPSSEFKLNYLNKQQADNNFMTCIVPSDKVTPTLYMENSKEERYLTILLKYGYYNEIEKNIKIQPIEVVNK